MLTYYYSNSCQTNKNFKNFRNQGFRHFNAMYPLMPHAARGAHVFHPSQQMQGVALSLLPPPIQNGVDNEAETDSASGDEQRGVAVAVL